MTLRISPWLWFRTWREQFRRRCNGLIQALINRTIGSLRADIPDFADRHCENEHIGQLWRWKVEGANIDEQLQELQRDLHREAVDKIRTLGEELAKEMELLSAEFEAPDLKGGRIHNHRRIWDLGTRGLAGALSLASWAVRATPLAPLAPILMRASGVVTLVGQAFRGKFGDKDQRRREAIGKITPKLNRSLDQLETSVREVFARWMEEGLVGPVVNNAIGQLEAAAVSTQEVADFYRDQARELNQRQRRLNLELLRTAMRRIDGSVAIPDHTTTVARVPGQLIVIEDGEGLDEPHIRGLQDLLQEEVATIQPGLPLHRLMEWATGKPAAPDAVTINERRATARAAYDPGDPGTLARVVVARQLTGLNITSSN